MHNKKRVEKLDVYAIPPEAITNKDYTFSIFYLILNTIILSQALRYYKLSFSAYQRD